MTGVGPATPKWQRHRAITPLRFRLIRFRSPLLTESLLFSFPRGTEMFQFPRFPLPVLCVQTGVTPLRVLGFPIRISTDQSLVGSSPWLFAATHVLHRCQVPRHPPLAFCSLEEQRCSCSLCSSQGACKAPLTRRGAASRGVLDKSQQSLCEETIMRSLPQNRREDSNSNLECSGGGNRDLRPSSTF